MRALLLPIAALFWASPAAAEETRGDLIYIPAIQEMPEEEASFEQAVLVSYGAMFERAVLYRDPFGVMPVHTDNLAIIPIDYQLDDDSLYIVIEFGDGAELSYGLVETEDPLFVADEWGIWGSLGEGPGRIAGLSFFLSLGPGTI